MTALVATKPLFRKEEEAYSKKYFHKDKKGRFALAEKRSATFFPYASFQM